jgi:hypothetical protein
MNLNTQETSKDWEEGFYESAWTPGTLTMSDDEKALLKDLCALLPRHMPIYDWERPWAEAILLIVRRHSLSNDTPL